MGLGRDALELPYAATEVDPDGGEGPALRTSRLGVDGATGVVVSAAATN